MLHDEKTVVASHEDIGNGYRRLVLEAPQIVASVQPGQFVHIKVPALEASALRRPLSVLDACDGKLHLLFKRVGRGTDALAAVREGDEVMVEGPLGHGFPVESKAVALLVGGGFGVAPLYFLAKRRAALGLESVLFVGGRTKDDLLEVEAFGKLGVKAFTATNDGSAGVKGFVVAPLDEEIVKLRQQGSAFELFTCGPDGLLKAVSERAMSLGVPGWISVDRHMICGVGACFACIQKTVRGNSRCCIEGPVFKAEDLVW
jgi:dihydroorotate dehydrogenase electron transfer subunit